MPLLVYGEPPEYATLKCPNPKCENRTEFIEDAFTETTQSFSIDPDDPGLQPDWDSFDSTTHYAYAIRCGECDAVVWQAPASEDGEWFEVRSSHPPSARWFENEAGEPSDYPSEEAAREAVTEAVEEGAMWNGMPVVGPFRIYRVRRRDDLCATVPNPNPAPPG